MSLLDIVKVRAKGPDCFSFPFLNAAGPASSLFVARVIRKALDTSIPWCLRIPKTWRRGKTKQYKNKSPSVSCKAFLSSSPLLT